MLQDSGFTDVVIGEAVDTFGGAKGEANARAFDVYGYAFMATLMNPRWMSWRSSAGPAERPRSRYFG
jgi:hypothetical protein